MRTFTIHTWYGATEQMSAPSATAALEGFVEFTSALVERDPQTGHGHHTGEADNGALGLYYSDAEGTSLVAWVDAEPTIRPVTIVAEYISDADEMLFPMNDGMRTTATVVVLPNGTTEMRVPVRFYDDVLNGSI